MKFYKRIWFRVVSVLIILTIVLCGAFLIYVSDYYHASNVAAQALRQEQTVSVTNDDSMIVFAPKSSQKNTGFIFYPGAKVEDTAYAPLMQQLAQKGITCVIMKMPFHLAIFRINAADQAIGKLKNIDSWYIGGHSLGGAMASAYAAGHANQLKGIVFLGAYPSSNLKNTNLRMLSLYGSQDKVLNRKSLASTRADAPKDAQYFEIPGGNHAYYGDYGAQAGDGKATITREVQQQITADKIDVFIRQVS